MAPTIELGEFLLSSGQADLESFDFAEPALSFGLGDAVEQVVAGLHDAVALVWIRAKEAASEAAVLVDAAGPVGASAVAQGDLAVFEVAKELIPFLIGRGSVFLAGAGHATAGDERAVAVDDLLGIDR
ncbi:hypothetical protein [Streptomyces sp. NBC_00154]|uniref:hypothetical protein n=1 Tax=Streptomyces sp. NBC_00154 TaxID=2975670 RepID=UPI002253A4B4|nr:hypothetical protein [Streptomyces sp. NBC_00154]MCX5318001.1 hypothetical protein [Streptomyces sp. NBC_00154]